MQIVWSILFMTLIKALLLFFSSFFGYKPGVNQQDKAWQQIVILICSHIFHHFYLFIPPWLRLCYSCLGWWISCFFLSPESPFSDPPWLLLSVHFPLLMFISFKNVTSSLFLFLNQSQSIFMFSSPHKLTLKILTNNTDFTGAVSWRETLKLHGMDTVKRPPNALYASLLFSQSSSFPGHFPLLIWKTLSILPLQAHVFLWLCKTRPPPQHLCWVGVG